MIGGDQHCPNEVPCSEYILTGRQLFTGVLLEERGADGATLYRRAEEIQSGIAASTAAAGGEEDFSAIVSADEQSAQVRFVATCCPSSQSPVWDGFRVDFWKSLQLSQCFRVNCSVALTPICCFVSSCRCPFTCLECMLT